jgi:hypothetical protein
MGEPEPDDAVLFVGVSLVLGIASRHLLRGTRVPYTVALLVLGVALGSLGKRWNFLPSTSCTAMDGRNPPFLFPYLQNQLLLNSATHCAPIFSLYLLHCVILLPLAFQNTEHNMA